MAALSTISVNCPSDLFDVANKDMMDISEKAAAEGKRRRKSAMRDFRTQEEYEKFAKSRNAATKRYVSPRGAPSRVKGFARLSTEMQLILA